VSFETAENPTLFIGILSYCAAHDRRNAIRQTWLSSNAVNKLEADFHIHWRFVLGEASRSEKSEFCSTQSLKWEADKFGDLLLLDDLPESYNVITRKTLAMFKWENDVLDADFVFKTDDDSYLNLPALVADLLQVDSSHIPIYWGNQQVLWVGHAASFDASSGARWYIKPEEFPLDAQKYAAGAGYLLSRPLVKHLAGMFAHHGASLQLPWLPEERLGWLEDATVGYLLRGAVNSASRVSVQGVMDAWWPENCFDNFYVVHHVAADHQFHLHNMILHSERGHSTGVCKQLMEFAVDIPTTNPSEQVKALKWGGSILDRNLSPLLSMSPPPFKSPLMKSTVENPATPFGRDVIVITGASHNIGLYLLETIQQGYSRMSGPITIVVLDIAHVPTEESSIFPQIAVHWRQVDITDFNAVIDTLSAYMERIRGVVHLAAVSRVQECHSDPHRCEEVNVQGTKNILSALWSLYGLGVGATNKFSAAGRPPLPWLIFASSREVYGSLQPGQIVDEKSPLQPLNIYGETKLKAENTIQHWALKTGFNAVILRFSNVYGSCHDHGSRIVPRIVSKLVSGDYIEIFGSSDKTISLLHIQDAVQALLLGMSYAERIDNGAGFYEAFNIGGGSDHDVFKIKDIIHIIQSTVATHVPGCKFCHKPPKVLDVTDRSPEPEHFQASIKKAFRVLGYSTSMSFNEATMKAYVDACVLRGGSTQKHAMQRAIHNHQ
jgi:nucleoside-diphosphate-sugar epimerase